MVFTAEQARSLSKPKSIDVNIVEYLDGIYLEIEKFARKGRNDIVVSLKPLTSSHKEYLSTSFRDNGYKVKFVTYTSFHGGCGEDLIVSWKE